MSARITEAAFKRRLVEVNPTIEMVPPYNGYTRKGKFRCTICNNEWTAQRRGYIEIRNGYKRPFGCKVCRSRRSDNTMTQKLAQKKLNESFSDNIVIIDEYKCASAPCLMICKTCGYRWRTNVSAVLCRNNGNGCPKCNNKNQNNDRLLTLDDIKNRYDSILYNVVIKDYDADKRIIEFECKSCENRFTRTDRGRLRMKQIRCPVCYSAMSSGEFVVYQILKYNNINFKKEYPIINAEGGHQRIDYYIVEYNYAFEIQGPQHYDVNDAWHRDNAKHLDELKAKWCKNNGVALFYLYPNNDLYNQISKILSVTKPPDDYFVNKEANFKEIIRYLKDGHNKTEACEYFNVGMKKVDRFIRTAGYANYFDLYHKTRMKKLGLTDEKIINWLRHNHFSHIEKGLGVTKKYVINHIFKNPVYPYCGTWDIKVETIKSEEFTNYLESHSIRDTERYFMTDANTITEILGSDTWKKREIENQA